MFAAAHWDAFHWNLIICKHTCAAPWASHRVSNTYLDNQLYMFFCYKSMRLIEQHRAKYEEILYSILFAHHFVKSKRLNEPLQTKININDCISLSCFNLKFYDEYGSHG